MRTYPLSVESIAALPRGLVGYVGARGYGFIRVFERDALGKFEHRCWKGAVVQRGDAAHVYDQSLCDFGSVQEAHEDGAVFFAEEFSQEFSEFACRELGIPCSRMVNTTPM